MGIFIGLFLLVCVVYAGSYVYEFHNNKRMSDRDAYFCYAVLTLAGMAVICIFIWPAIPPAVYEIEIKR